MSANDGGAAFPRPHSDCTGADCIHSQEGMSLRDYFAAKAMQAIVVRSENLSTADRVQHAANDAYVMADAMLNARECATK